jgi:aldehyde:ferredoxin oxidoreductase
MMPPRRLLKINLTTQQITTESIDPQWAEDFIGGSGLAARILWDVLTPSIDPLGPENPLLFLNGPLTGLAGPSVGRFVVCSRSPATHLWAESNCGGFWGPELAFAGYDGVLIIGRAQQPTYIWINDDRVELRAAPSMWGHADTYETQNIIRTELNESLARIMCIGLAGERLIPYSSILCDHGRVAGRTGLGAVMGSKNLKAVAVRGHGKPNIARPDQFKPLRAAANRELKDDNVTLGLRASGSGAAAELFQMYGEMPMGYFTRGSFIGQENISGNVMNDTILSGVTTCHACVIACGRLVTINDGPYARSEGKGPEYETMVGFGSNLLSDDLAATTHLGQMCDRYGLDTISTSNTIGLAYLLYERGLIKPADIVGLELNWGDPRPAGTLIEMIAHGHGLGKVMSQGAKALAKHFGVEELAVQVNNLEVAYHDPRAMASMMLTYATSPRGACHNQSDVFLAEIGTEHAEWNIPMLQDPLSEEGKAQIAMQHQNYRSVDNSLVLCFFAHVPGTTALNLLNAAVGLDWTMTDMHLAGDRIWNLKRAINNRFGLTRANDKLPKLLLEPLPDGPIAGHVPNFDRLLSEYYEVRGWDEQSGKPKREKLLELGLKFVSDVLWGSNNS